MQTKLSSKAFSVPWMLLQSTACLQIWLRGNLRYQSSLLDPASQRRESNSASAAKVTHAAQGQGPLLLLLGVHCSPGSPEEGVISLQVNLLLDDFTAGCYRGSVLRKLPKRPAHFTSDALPLPPPHCPLSDDVCVRAHVPARSLLALHLIMPGKLFKCGVLRVLHRGHILFYHSADHAVLFCSGCHNKVLPTGGLKQQKRFSQFWRLEV